jgi:hypothetical protein
MGVGDISAHPAVSAGQMGCRKRIPCTGYALGMPTLKSDALGCDTHQTVALDTVAGGTLTRYPFIEALVGVIVRLMTVLRTVPMTAAR